MPDTEIQTLKTTETILKHCPVPVMGKDDFVFVELCGEPLDVILNTDIVGDDYGSWSIYDVGFRCGHSFADMKKSMKFSEQI